MYPHRGGGGTGLPDRPPLPSQNTLWHDSSSYNPRQPAITHQPLTFSSQRPAPPPPPSPSAFASGRPEDANPNEFIPSGSRITAPPTIRDSSLPPPRNFDSTRSRVTGAHGTNRAYHGSEGNKKYQESGTRKSYPPSTGHVSAGVGSWSDEPSRDRRAQQSGSSGGRRPEMTAGSSKWSYSDYRHSDIRRYGSASQGQGSNQRGSGSGNDRRGERESRGSGPSDRASSSRASSYNFHPAPQPPTNARSDKGKQREELPSSSSFLPLSTRLPESTDEMDRTVIVRNYRPEKHNYLHIRNFLTSFGTAYVPRLLTPFPSH
ncbi:hypothetical protein T439DRAFT_182394 [Meredithblackwellia eburnea MCA 4105]